MDIEEIKQKMRQSMVDLFEQIEEGVKFAEYENTPIPGGEC